jgi:hypothetical protein
MSLLGADEEERIELPKIVMSFPLPVLRDKRRGVRWPPGTARCPCGTLHIVAPASAFAPVAHSGQRLFRRLGDHARR